MNEKSWKRERTRDWDRRNHYIPVTSCCSHVCSSTTAYTPLVQSRERDTLNGLASTVIQTTHGDDRQVLAQEREKMLTPSVCPSSPYTLYNLGIVSVFHVMMCLWAFISKMWCVCTIAKIVQGLT